MVTGLPKLQNSLKELCFFFQMPAESRLPLLYSDDLRIFKEEKENPSAILCGMGSPKYLSRPGRALHRNRPVAL